MSNVNLTRPIELKIKPALGGEETDVSIFTSYSFDRNILVPASAFRFTAEGIDAKQRQAIRSADLVSLYVRNSSGRVSKLSTGFIDETDTHVTPTSVSYVLTGRDTIGQLVDNAAIDADNKIVHGGQANLTMVQIAQELVKNTRMAQSVVSRNTPAGGLLYQTNPGETKISVLQRYLEIMNCLAWTTADGVLIIGKPTMAVTPINRLWMTKDAIRRQQNNLLEVRVKRSPNLAIRKIAVQMQDLAITDPTPATVNNTDPDMVSIATAKAGRSVYRTFSLGNGTEAYDKLVGVGNGQGVVSMGKALALREMAMDNAKVLDVECVVAGHINENGDPYDIDQVYEVVVDDDGLALPMYVYGVRHDYTKERGPITSLRLCKIGALVWGTPSA